MEAAYSSEKTHLILFTDDQTLREKVKRDLGDEADKFDIDTCRSTTELFDCIGKSDREIVIIGLTSWEHEKLEEISRKLILEKDIPVIAIIDAETNKSKPSFEIPEHFFAMELGEQMLANVIYCALYRKNCCIHYQKQAYRLEIQQRQLRILIENNADAMIVVDVSGIIVFSNKAARQLFSENGHDISGREYGYPLITNEYTEIDIIREKGKSCVGEMRAVEIEWYGETAYLVTIRDITERRKQEIERKNMQDKMRQAQKLESLGVLAGGVAHDFNNLLMGIMGNASMMQDELPSESPLHGGLKQILDACQRAADLAKQMLAYSGKGRFLLQPVNLAFTIHQMKEFLEASVPKNAVLQYHLDSKTPQFNGDISQVRQVIVNLVTNAYEAIGKDPGSIEIKTGTCRYERKPNTAGHIYPDIPDGYYVCLTVKDTGCGIAPPDMAQLFDPFFSTKFTGRGMGLAATMGIVKGHNGGIGVKSLPGRGAEFSVYWPLAEEKTILDDSPSDSKINLSKARVLVVDDEKMVRDLARRMLEREGASVCVARDGIEALELFKDFNGEFDLVLLDLTMPRMDGEKTLEEIHKINPEMKVLLSSGYTEQQMQERFEGKTLAGFIQKPYRVLELVNKVRESLQ
ncbi:MAG: response regulator [Candidatus Sumerlaeia bacterium]